MTLSTGTGATSVSEWGELPSVFSPNYHSVSGRLYHTKTRAQAYDLVADEVDRFEELRVEIFNYLADQGNPWRAVVLSALADGEVNLSVAEVSMLEAICAQGETDVTESAALLLENGGENAQRALDRLSKRFEEVKRILEVSRSF